MSTEQAIEERVISIVRQYAVEPSGKIVATTELEKIGVDSLDQVDIVLKIEESYDIEISDEDANRIKTVGDAVRLVKEKVGTA